MAKCLVKKVFKMQVIVVDIEVLSGYF